MFDFRWKEYRFFIKTVISANAKTKNDVQFKAVCRF